MNFLTSNKCRALAAMVATLIVVVPAFSQSAPGGSDFVRSGFTVYSGDVNSDGYVDILLKAQKRIAFFNLDDIPIPIVIPTPIKSFVVLSNGSGSYSVVTSVTDSMLNSSVWRADTYDLRLGDILGNGVGGTIIEARNSGDPSFSVAVSGGAPQLIQVLTPGIVGVDLGAAGVTSELRDRNADGRTDLTIYRDGLVMQVLYADANGQFVANQEATLRAVWLGFKSGLDDGNAGNALAYISTASTPFYSEIFEAFGSQRLRSLSATWTDVKAIALRPTYASFSIVDTFNGIRSVHIIVFEIEGDRWVLTTL